MIPTRDDLIDAFEAAVAAAEPVAAVTHHLTVDDHVIAVDGMNVGRFDPDSITVIGIGKASIAMATAVCDITGASSATVATPYATDADPRIAVHVGGHPIPTEASVKAGEALVSAVATCGSDDLVIAVVSGGGSAAAEVPTDGVSIDDLQILNDWLLGSGMTIVELNEVRSAVSGLKAGRLAAATSATVVTLVLSDVVGAGPEFVASGPTIPSELGLRASAILASRPDSAMLPESIHNAIAAIRSPSVVAGPVSVVGSAASSASAAAERLSERGFSVSIVTEAMEGEARNVALGFVETCEPGVVCIATGETTVTLSGDAGGVGPGVGGRNQEAALAVMKSLSESGGIFAAMGTDGIDGPTDAAGAVVDALSLRSAVAAGWDVDAELGRHNANPVLADAGAIVKTGPTGTNVCDLWMWWKPTIDAR